MSNGVPVVVVFFGQHPVHGVMDNVDKDKVVISFGLGAWTVTAPRRWVRQTDDGSVIELG